VKTWLFIGYSMRFSDHLLSEPDSVRAPAAADPDAMRVFDGLSVQGARLPIFFSWQTLCFSWRR
jgi:hypothetical protein